MTPLEQAREDFQNEPGDRTIIALLKLATEEWSKAEIGDKDFAQHLYTVAEWLADDFKE